MRMAIRLSLGWTMAWCCEAALASQQALVPAARVRAALTR
jgi:hypothetical protein